MNDPSGGDGHDQDRELPTAAEVVGHWNEPQRTKTTVYGAHHLEKGDRLVRLEDAEQALESAEKGVPEELTENETSNEKGNRIENEAKKILQKVGYRVEKVDTFTNHDPFRLLDLLAIKDGKRTKFVQVKSNSISEKQMGLYGQYCYTKLPSHIDFEVWVKHDYQGWEFYRYKHVEELQKEPEEYFENFQSIGIEKDIAGKYQDVEHSRNPDRVRQRLLDLIDQQITAWRKRKTRLQDEEDYNGDKELEIAKAKAVFDELTELREEVEQR